MILVSDLDGQPVVGYLSVRVPSIDRGFAGEER